MSFSPPLRPWLGTYPECGGVAVYRESVSGRIVGACCAGSECWWAGEVEEEKVTTMAGCQTGTSQRPAGTTVFVNRVD